MTVPDQASPFDLLGQAKAAGAERPAAAVLLVNHAGQVLLVRRAATTVMGGLWEIPGGGVEEGERPVDAAQRELGEETGITTARFTAYLGHADYDNAHGVRVREFTFAATLDHDHPVHLSAEHDAHQWVLPTELPTYLADHERDQITRHTSASKPLVGHQPLPAYLTSIPAAPLWAGLLFTTSSGEAVMLRAVDRSKGLQYPGGDVDFTDASPLHTAVRETWEETGLTVEPDPDLLPLVATVVQRPRGGWPTKVGFVYFGGVLSPTQLTAIRLDPHEHDDIVTLSEADIQDHADPDVHALTQAVLGAVRSGIPAHYVR